MYLHAFVNVSLKTCLITHSKLVLNICSLPMVVEMDSKFSLILHPDPLLNKKSTAKLPTILDSFKPRLTVSGECTWVVTEQWVGKGLIQEKIKVQGRVMGQSRSTD